MSLEEGPGYNKNITIIPIITSSDKTQLTQFHGKLAYPVYIAISNIPKHICWKPFWQGQVLLAHLPTSKLDHIINKASRHHCMSNLFHHCMQVIVKPLESAGHKEIILVSGDGAVRKRFPILTTHVGDYLEQVLVSLVRTGNCPICPAPHDEIDKWESNLEPCDTQKIIDTLNSINKGAAEFIKACANAGIKPVQCIFWKNLPFVDIYCSIMPDILHQLYQGLLKHLMAWIQTACGDAEIDAWCCCFPPNHHIWLFMKGISHLSCVTGMELKFQGFFWVGCWHSTSWWPFQCMVGSYSPHSPWFHLSSQISNPYFWNTGSNEWCTLHVPFKLWHFHFSWYLWSFQYFQASQCWSLLWIYSALWLNRQFQYRIYWAAAHLSCQGCLCFDKLQGWVPTNDTLAWPEGMHDATWEVLHWHLDMSFNMPLHVQKPIPSLIPEHWLQMTKHPTHQGVPIEVVCTKYGTTQFIPALSWFIAQYQHPQYSKAQVKIASNSIHIPFSKVSVFHHLKFVSYDVYSLNPLNKIVVDSIHIDLVQVWKCHSWPIWYCCHSD